MPKTILQGRASHQLRSMASLLSTSLGVLARRAIGKPLVPEWSSSFEIATLFYRHQFGHALKLPTMAESRAYFDSLYTMVDANVPVDVKPSAAGEPHGDWFIPRGHKSPMTMLYLHGGGYAFYGAVSRHFAAMLAHQLQMPLFAPDYRLTPEHPQPAQIDDAVAAYRHLLAIGIDPHRLVVSGDSAGGHLALMLLLRLRREGLGQPALTLALSPWTDIGRRGRSQFGHDRYDMVQGYQTLLYGRWLKGETGATDAQLSPVHQDFRGLAPIYIQAGGKEILVDMIRDFAFSQVARGSRVRLDVWEHMTHEFHAYGDTLLQSLQAFESLRAAIAWANRGGKAPYWPARPQTEVDGLDLA